MGLEQASVHPEFMTFATEPATCELGHGEAWHFSKMNLGVNCAHIHLNTEPLNKCPPRRLHFRTHTGKIEVNKDPAKKTQQNTHQNIQQNTQQGSSSVNRLTG